MKYRNAIWFRILAVLLLLALAGFVYVWMTRAPGHYVTITRDGTELHRVPLDEPQTIRITEEDGRYNVVEVAEGAVSIVEANCPDQLCVKQGAIRQSGLPIVCLPHRLVVEVSGASGSELDGVTG